MEGLRRIPARARIGLRPVGDSAPLAASLLGLQVNWPLALLAVVATLVVVVLLVPMLRGPKERAEPPATGHRERRRAPVTGRREAREALALVGEALAATHNPRALMPVVLNVITEATGARGGRLMHDGETLTRNEAILRHAGQATQVINNYRALSNTQKNQLITFLNSL